jgi:hypothetical protein
MPRYTATAPGRSGPAACNGADRRALSIPSGLSGVSGSPFYIVFHRCLLALRKYLGYKSIPVKRQIPYMPEKRWGLGKFDQISPFHTDPGDLLYPLSRIEGPACVLRKFSHKNNSFERIVEKILGKQDKQQTCGLRRDGGRRIAEIPDAAGCAGSNDRTRRSRYHRAQAD